MNHKVFFKNLDSIRFIACLMVFLQHGIRPSFEYLPIKNTLLGKLLNVVSDGGYGVSIFFVLSGFLITYLLITEYELNSKISVKSFYIRRILRIWPLYFLIIAFSFFIYPMMKSFIGMNHPLSSNIIYYVTFLSNFDLIHIQKYHPGKDASMQDITWSVSIEEQFYLFWPLLFALFPKKTWGYLIGIVIVISVAFRIINHDDFIVLHYSTLSNLLDLGFGGLLAYLIMTYNNIRSLFEKASTSTHIILFAISFSLLFLNDSIIAIPYGNAVGRVFVSLFLALIIAAQAITKVPSKLNLHNLSFANKWGKYTYGIYLIHPIILTLCDVTVRVLHIPKENFIILFSLGVTAFIITLAVSKLSYVFFESKFLVLKDRFQIIKAH